MTRVCRGSSRSAAFRLVAEFSVFAFWPSRNECPHRSAPTPPRAVPPPHGRHVPPGAGSIPRRVCTCGVREPRVTSRTGMGKQSHKCDTHARRRSHRRPVFYPSASPLLLRSQSHQPRHPRHPEIRGRGPVRAPRRGQEPFGGRGHLLRPRGLGG